MLSKSNQRIEWIDALKGIGIILVLIGHCGIENINQYIYLFHMPLFFMISGFCWNVEKNRSILFSDFIKKKFKAYVVPYLKVSAICFIIFGLGANLIRIGYGTEYFQQLAKYLFGIFIYSRGTTEWLPNCSPIWFLTTLFFAELLFYWVMKAKKPILLVFLAGILGYVCYLIGKVFPWNLDNAFITVPYLYVGCLLRRYWSHCSSSCSFILSGIASVLIFTFGFLGGDYDGNNLSLIYVKFWEALIITLSLALLCQRVVGGAKLLIFLGQNTLIILGYNYAINAILHFIVPSIDQSWLMAGLVVVLEIILVFFTNRFTRLKNILI